MVPHPTNALNTWLIFDWPTDRVYYDQPYLEWGLATAVRDGLGLKESLSFKGLLMITCQYSYKRSAPRTAK